MCVEGHQHWTTKRGVLLTAVLATGVTFAVSHASAGSVQLNTMEPFDIIEDLPAGVEVSGCALNAGEDRLIIVEDSDVQERIRSYTLDRTLVHTITLNGFDDTEALCQFNAESNIYAMAEEGLNEINLITFDTNVTQITKIEPAYISMGLTNLNDSGIEGLAYDAASNCFYAAREKPPSVYRVTGLGTQATTELLFTFTNVTDLAGLAFDDDSRHLVLLSQENNLLMEADLGGSILSSKALSFTKPEGVTLTRPATNVIVVGEYRQYQRFYQTDDDTDDDGLNDAWEIAQFGNLQQIASGDVDRDGLSNLLEQERGSDPTQRLAPPWWSTYLVVNTNAAANDLAALNQGQLKWIATNAYNAAQATLSGGAGSNVTALVTGFSATANYAGVNIGQLKTVAKPFYDRLQEAGQTDRYPWQGAASTNDHALANIGQAKHIFSFSID